LRESKSETCENEVLKRLLKSRRSRTKDRKTSGRPASPPPPFNTSRPR